MAMSDVRSHVWTLEGQSSHVSDVWSVAFDPTNINQLASGSQDRTIKLWDITTDECLRTLDHSGSVNSVAFDPTNSNQLASASYDRTIKLWTLRPASACEL
eukprot:SAG11_NODE_2476_length_3313_cov_4.959241_1_plen_101_part_00